jgi:hypothetical protein
MKRAIIASAAGLMSGGALADNVANLDRLLCATGQIVICVEEDECYPVLPSDVGVPDFVIVDVKGKVLSTTKASEENRTTAIASVNRKDGLVYLQGIDLGRVFSVVIDEATGRMTASVARDGATVSVFGACTSAAL